MKSGSMRRRFPPRPRHAPASSATSGCDVLITGSADRRAYPPPPRSIHRGPAARLHEHQGTADLAELNVGLGCNPEAIAKLLWNRHLTLARDAHDVPSRWRITLAIE